MSKQQEILVTGATGFLGRALIKELMSQHANVVALCHSISESFAKFRREFPDVDYFIADIRDKQQLRTVFDRRHITHVVHAAAIKYINLCQDNPADAIQTNVIGSHNMVEICQDFGVENAILISTDKAVNPSSIYGSTKQMAAHLFLHAGYSVFEGVNFIGSTGSVLDRWTQSINNGAKKIELFDPDAVRYFTPVEDVVVKLISSLDNQGAVFTVDKCYKIKMQTLANAFWGCRGCSDYPQDHIDVNYGKLSWGEKQIEELPSPGTKVIEPSVPDVMNLIGQYVRHKF